MEFVPAGQHPHQITLLEPGQADGALFLVFLWTAFGRSAQELVDNGCRRRLERERVRERYSLVDFLEFSYFLVQETFKLIVINPNSWG